VTTEDDFHAALDANPDDWHTRLVFADWLQECGDVRADGYRALGLWRVMTIRIQMADESGEPSDDWQWIYGTDENLQGEARAQWGKCFMPGLWFKKLKQRNKHDGMPWWRYYDTRREAEDCAAYAFLRLGTKRRTELLNPPPVPNEPPPEPEPKPGPAPRKKRSRKGGSGETS
jgi:uncharacterized protein (TIGR02996 family)